MRKHYIWFNLVTIFFLTILLVIAMSFEAFTGVGGMFALFIALAYWARREQKLRQKKFEDYHPDFDALHKAIDEHVEEFNQYMNSAYDSCLLDTKNVKYCKTCGESYFGDGKDLCVELRDVFPHHPADDPPKKNPYKFIWEQYNGYAPPFVFQPKNILDNETEKRLALGKMYYSINQNIVWDLGLREPPAWYVESRINRLAEKQS